jgi:hypothetical protein
VLQLNVGDVIDFDLTFQIQNDFFGVAETAPVSLVVAAATVGEVYCLALDFAAATANVPPVDYPTVLS